MSDKSSHPRGSGGGPTDEALQRARFALHNRRPEDAERIARDLLKGRPRHKRALNILGYALLMQARADDAIETLEPAARDLRDPEIETQLGLALRQARRDEDAVAQLRRATSRRPPFAPAFLELGSLLFSMRRYDEAVEALSRGLEAEPIPEISIQLGHALLALRDRAAAKIAFSNALGLVPNAVSALWGMGKAEQELGDHKAAIEYFRRCLMQAPNEVGTLLNLGHSLFAVGNLDAGYEAFRAAARGDQKRYATALTTLVKLDRGRFWLRPSAAARFLRGQNSRN
jgi:tetratricopeptide (TPR) repeat protein